MPRSVPALLLSIVYAAALAVAVTDPGQHAVAGVVVLAGLTARWFLRHRRAPHTVVAPRLAVVPAPVDSGMDVVPAAHAA
jgi:hypothetical protein